MSRNEFELSKWPVSATDLKAAIKWYTSKTPKQREALVKRYKIVTYQDLIAVYKEGS